MSKNKYLFPFVLVTSLFFLWAFLHNINPILIPHLKKACQLSDMQSSFIDASVYLSYFLIAIPAGMVMHKYGYRKAIMVGLFFYAIGALLVLPAADTRNYAFFLFAFFIIAAGATFLETAANPYITILGSPESAERRLNLAQSFNGIGAFLAPILGGKFILTGIEHSKKEIANLAASNKLSEYLQIEANTIKFPYLIIAIAVLILLVIFAFSKLPDFKNKQVVNSHGINPKFSFAVFKYRNLRWAVLAQFFYVGAQVGVGSFFIRYAKFVADVNEKNAAYLYGSVAMVGFMAGRFVGTFLMKFIRPNVLLSIYSAINIILLCLSLFLSGNVALYLMMVVPFFMSIMYPTIFALGIKGLGEDTKFASSFLVMSIVGGALTPILMGFISDITGSIQKAYAIPLFCFLVVAWYGINGYKANKTQRK